MKKNIIAGKKILITGGTGSFGSTMMKALLELSPKRIIIFSRDEWKQYEMRNKYSSPILQFVIGDVRNLDSVEEVMQGVDYVFHAAALKQVPSCEFFPLEAIRTNTLGGYNVMKAAVNKGVKKVVVLSTDKAVYPINAMGMSKALMEKVMIATSKELENHHSNTVLCGVRYGNVMYSRGSVVPYFVELVKKNKKPKITNPKMTRFLLPLKFSVELVLYALSDGKNGHIYVRKAPATDIQTLARAICILFNKKDDFEIIGLRVGEKIHETLISKEEWMRVKDQGEFYSIPPETEGLDYDKYFAEGAEDHSLFNNGYTSDNVKKLNVGETVDLLKTLPEVREELKTWKKTKK